MKCVKGLGFLWVAVLAAFFALSACDDSSSATEDNNETSAVESSSSTTVNKDKSSESKTGDEISSSDEQDAGNTIEHSSSSRKTTSKSESSSSVFDSESSSSEGEVFSCTKEGNRVKIDGIPHICENGVYVLYIAPSSSSLSLHAKDSIKHPDEIFLDGKNFSFYIDSRDGLEKKYTVLREHTSSGDTLYVFVDNLNYGKQVLSSELEFDDNIVEKYCYNDDPWYCDNHYGALYTWSEAMALPKDCESLSQEDSRCQIKTSKKGGHQGICPDGWFVMTVNNWSDAHHDDYGMSRSSLSYAGDLHTYLGLIYTGHLQQFGKDTAEYESIWESAYFWSASENTSSDKATVFFTYNSMYEQTDYDRIVSKRNAYPVRCARIVEEAE
ncbi:MAG: hypothetical protein IKB43_00885 [Fibrobacter sp.]|nr:hypothetical protein [Fibrobacter sp.]